jgi:hypothetical protein
MDILKMWTLVFSHMSVEDLALDMVTLVGTGLFQLNFPLTERRRMPPVPPGEEEAPWMLLN